MCLCSHWVCHGHSRLQYVEDQPLLAIQVVCLHCPEWDNDCMYEQSPENRKPGDDSPKAALGRSSDGKKVGTKGRTSEGSQAVGTLKRRLVAPQTQALYNSALALLTKWLKAAKLELPTNQQELLPLLEQFAEELWQEGESKADLANLLSALELAEAELKTATRSAWRLYGAWKCNRMQPRCTKKKWLRALVGRALKNGWCNEAFVLLLGFG